MSGTDWSQYFPVMEERREKMMAHPHEDVYVTSQDGLKLHGTFFPREGKKTVICFHGYTSKGMSDYVGLSGYYLPRGYNLLLIDERAHGESEGTYIGFGALDRKDGLCWIRYVQERLGEDCEIWLHGMSMGAATVVMMSGLELPACVKGIISDCAFTCAWDVFDHVLRTMYHLPSYPDPGGSRADHAEAGRLRTENLRRLPGSEEGERTYSSPPWRERFLRSMRYEPEDLRQLRVGSQAGDHTGSGAL